MITKAMNRVVAAVGYAGRRRRLRILPRPSRKTPRRTIELGNYPNLVLREGLIIFGIVLVAFAVWRFVQQPGMKMQAA